MPINFPSSPTNGQAYTENSTTWIYDTTAGAWVAAGKSTLALSNTSGVSFAGNLNFPTGNVGIGLSSPTSNLHVVGKANIRSELETSLLVESNGRTSISFGRGTDNIGGHLISTTNSQAILAGGGYYNGSSWIASSSNSAYLQFSQGVTAFFSNTGATVGGVPTLIENARITDNGRVGIGTSSPGALLHVGSTDVQYTPRIGTRFAGNAIEFGHTNQAGYGSVLGAEAGSGAPFLAFNCGAGTNTNTYKTFGIKGVVIKTDNAGGLLFNTVDTAATTDNQSLTERMRVTSGGLVGIANSAPVYPLQVDGQTLIRGSTTIAYPPITAGLYVTYTGAGSMYGQAFLPAQNTTTSIIFYNAGRGSIGSISQNTSHVAYNTTSDYRLKENIEPLSDGTLRLLMLKPRRFNFIGETYTMDGFIAHEVQEVVPEAVTGEKDAVDEQGNIKPQAMDAAKLIPVLTAALQEAVTKINTLEQRIQQLESN